MYISTLCIVIQIEIYFMCTLHMCTAHHHHHHLSRTEIPTIAIIIINSGSTQNFSTFDVNYCFATVHIHTWCCTCKTSTNKWQAHFLPHQKITQFTLVFQTIVMQNLLNLHFLLQMKYKEENSVKNTNNLLFFYFLSLSLVLQQQHLAVSPLIPFRMYILPPVNRQ